MASSDHDSLSFDIVSEEVVYSRYLTVFDRVVRYTNADTKQVRRPARCRGPLPQGAQESLPGHPATHGDTLRDCRAAWLGALLAAAWRLSCAAPSRT